MRFRNVTAWRQQQQQRGWQQQQHVVMYLVLHVACDYLETAVPVAQCRFKANRGISSSSIYIITLLLSCDNCNRAIRQKHQVNCATVYTIWKKADLCTSVKTQCDYLTAMHCMVTDSNTWCLTLKYKVSTVNPDSWPAAITFSDMFSILISHCSKDPKIIGRYLQMFNR